jgi:hypothetical protein
VVDNSRYHALFLSSWIDYGWRLAANELDGAYKRSSVSKYLDDSEYPNNHSSTALRVLRDWTGQEETERR